LRDFAEFRHPLASCIATAYLRRVRRLTRFLLPLLPLLPLLIAAQLLLTVPAMAHAPGAGGGNTSPCEEMASPMAGATHEGGCPCCPDDSGSMQGCLVTCSLAAAIAATEFVVAVRPAHAAPSGQYTTHHTSLADPPLKPPPIA
jgi:hypothetical protein